MAKTNKRGKKTALFPNWRTSQQGQQLLHSKNHTVGTSLVAQWLRIRLPMQGTQIRALVQEDPTYRRATKPGRHNY